MPRLGPALHKAGHRPTILLGQLQSMAAGNAKFSTFRTCSMPQADFSQITCMPHPAHMAGWRMAPPAYQSLAASAPWHCRVLVWRAMHQGRRAGQSPALWPPGGRASLTFESLESVLLCSRGNGHWAHQLLLLGSAKAAQTGAEQHSSLAWGKVRQTEPWASRTLDCQSRCQVL
jgi:hypothetical protein